MYGESSTPVSRLSLRGFGTGHCVRLLVRTQLNTVNLKILSHIIVKILSHIIVKCFISNERGGERHSEGKGLQAEMRGEERERDSEGKGLQAEMRGEERERHSEGKGLQAEMRGEERERHSEGKGLQAESPRLSLHVVIR
eukprot:TRINITY_DN20174_c0_g2_i2.p2 TRINITY_DN20174_c0_g2~~TRINITY_DN20174_c0_g2_i2.p2  ORF type:complete len:140 (-),score=32.95 TRINITY_DN20174_c0_g2_i2:152-571(-)